MYDLFIHKHLDKTVDLCYRSEPFLTETKRIEFLFNLYDKYTAGLFAGMGKKKKNKNNIEKIIQSLPNILF